MTVKKSNLENSNDPYHEVVACPACGSEGIELIHDFGMVPLAGYFPKNGQADKKFLLPMQLKICGSCKLVQINPDVSDELLFEDYRYVSSVGMQSHFNIFAEWFAASGIADKSARILEIGCNDGPLLKSLQNHGYQPRGIDPAKNIVKNANDKGLDVICGYFNSKSVRENNLENSFDVVISCNSFAHISHINEIAQAVVEALTRDGVFIVEVQALKDLVESRSYDFVYHEHKYYYSIESITRLMEQHGLFLVDAVSIETHGGSIRFVFSRENLGQSKELIRLIQIENSVDLSSSAIATSIDSFMSELFKLRVFLKELASKGEVCVGLGASGRANMLLNYLGLESKTIREVYDESPERIDREMALTGIPVLPLYSARTDQVDYVVVLAWNMSEVLIEKWPTKTNRFIIPLPKLVIL